MYMKILVLGLLTFIAAKVAAGTVAFVDVNVIAMHKPGLDRNQTVLVEDGDIQWVGSVEDLELPSGSQVIDGRGRFLMPGLIDNHVHLEHMEDSEQLQLFLQHGVIAVRNMDGREHILDWRGLQSAGDLLGPKIFTASPLIDGYPPIWDDSIAIQSASEGRALVRAFANAGYDQIKVYSRLAKDAFLGILEEGSRHNLKVVGHIPSRVGLRASLQAGLYSFEHLSGIPAAIEPAASNWHPHKRYLVTPVDQQKLDNLLGLLAESDTYNCPTLVMHERSFVVNGDTFAWTHHPQLSALRKLTWLAAATFARDSASEKTVESARQLRNTFVKASANSGRLILGTDAGIPFIFPGDSVHTELDLMVAAGLTEFQALEAATKTAARFLSHDAGIVAPGYRADLLLLKKNPLEEIHHTRSISGVMIGGRWLDESQLTQIEAEVSW